MIGFGSGCDCPYSYENNGVRASNTRSGSVGLPNCAWVPVGGNNKTVDTPQSVRRVTFGGVENPCDFFSPEV